MADINNNVDPEKNEVKSGEREKLFANKEDSAVSLEDIGKNFFGDSLSDKKRSKGRKKLPLAVDIIITLIMLAIVAAIIFGAYYLFKYYTNDHKTIEVDYTFISYVDDEEMYNVEVGDRLYYDVDGSTVYFGKIREILYVENADSEKLEAIVFLVNVDVKYEKNQGYLIEDNRVAVGSDYVLRIGQKYLDGTIIEVWKASESAEKGGLWVPEVESDSESSSQALSESEDLSETVSESES